MISPTDTQFSEVTALSLSGRDSLSAKVNSAGEFAFLNIPVDQYLLLLDDKVLEANQLSVDFPIVNLVGEVETTVEIPVKVEQGDQYQGVVLAEGNKWLTFAWVQNQAGKNFAIPQPDNGKFSAFGSFSDSEEWIVHAPGYYSERVRPAQFVGGKEPRVITLERSPDTTQLSCGDGEVILPAESLATVEDDGITIESGWVWGECRGADTLRIRFRSQEILVQDSRFALEILPQQREWLYLFSGQVVLRDLPTGNEVKLEGDDMVNLMLANSMIPFTYDYQVVSTLTPLQFAPLDPFWKPTIVEQIQDQFQKFGVGTAKMITLVTYSLAILSFILVPLIVFFQQRRKKS